ncbi:MAG: ParB/Srx family N-terminal domain-containing protein [Myxococcota bacterium]
MKLDNWKVSELAAYEGNPREHSAEAVKQLAASLKRFGFRVPVLVHHESKTVIDGHFRLKAAREAGIESVPVLVVDDMSPQDIEAFRVSVNRMAELASWDEDALFRILEQLEKRGEPLGEESPVGFAFETVEVAPDELESWDFTPVADKFVVTVTGSLPLVAEVRKRLAGMEGVTIESSSLEIG